MSKYVLKNYNPENQYFIEMHNLQKTKKRRNLNQYAMKAAKTEKSKPKNNNKALENSTIVKRLKTEKEIKEKAFLYYAKGLTAKEVAKLLDLSFRTVQNWQTMEKWTEKINPDSLKQKCFELNKNGLSYPKIAEMLKISLSSVQRYVKQVKDNKKANKAI